MWLASIIYSTNGLVYLYSALWLLIWFSWTEVFFWFIRIVLFCDLLSLLLNLLQAYNIMFIFRTLFGSVFSSMYTVDVHLLQGFKLTRTIYLSFYKVCRKMKFSVSTFALRRKRTMQNEQFCGVNWSLKRWTETSHTLGIEAAPWFGAHAQLGRKTWSVQPDLVSFTSLFHSTFSCQMSPMVDGWQQCILNWMSQAHGMLSVHVSLWKEFTNWFVNFLNNWTQSQGVEWIRQIICLDLGC